MKLLNQLFAIIFYLLLFSWIVLKIRNVILIEKLNCRKIYKDMKKIVKKKKTSKVLFWFIVITIIPVLLYVVIAIIIMIVIFIEIFLCLFPVIVEGWDGHIIDSTFYDNIKNFLITYSSLYNYIGYTIYIIMYVFLVRIIYIDILCYKMLQDNELLDSLKQNIINNEIDIKTEKNNILWFIIIVIVVCILIFWW